MKTPNTESRCYRSGKYTVCRRLRTSFSPAILQAGAVKGLSVMVVVDVVVVGVAVVMTVI